MTQARSLQDIEMLFDSGHERKLSRQELRALLSHRTENMYEITTEQPDTNFHQEDEGSSYWWNIYDQPFYGSRTEREALIAAIEYAEGT